MLCLLRHHIQCSLKTLLSFLNRIFDLPQKNVDKLKLQSYNCHIKKKPVSKSSRFFQSFQRVSGWCELTAEDLLNGLVRAGRKPFWQVVSDGAQPLKWEAYVSMLLKRAFIVNLGGIAEVDFSRLLSLVGTEVFFVYVKTFTKERLVYDD